MIDLIGLAIAIPLLAAAVNMLFGARLGRWAGWFATAAMATSFAIVLGALLDLVSLPAEDRTQIVGRRVDPRRGRQRPSTCGSTRSRSRWRWS